MSYSAGLRRPAAFILPALCLALGLTLYLTLHRNGSSHQAVRAQSAESDPAAVLTALSSLQTGDRAAFESQSAALRDDPLYPYVRFAGLGSDLESAPDAAIESFLADFPDTPLAERLRAVYVKRLGATARWADLVRVYREDDAAERRCLYLRALVETGRSDQALTAAQLTPLWLVPRAQPAVCEPLFAAWRARSGLDADLIWRRIRLAMGAGETALARRLGRSLPAAERPWLTRWLALHAQPALLLRPGEAVSGHPLAPAILADGIARLADADPAGAARVLDASQAALAADPAASDLAQAAVGQALDQAGDPRGLAVWDRLSATADNLDGQERRLRAALARRDWARVADWVGRMPDRVEKRDRWLYWQGRAQAALGQEQAARESLTQAARSRSLWGMLAADRLDLPYPLASRPVPAESGRIARLAAAPALARIRALRALGRDADMRREWRTLTRTLDQPDLLAAAVVAAGLSWHDQAIFTLARTDYWDDLELRFPLAYRDLVAEQSWQSGVPQDWIYAVSRQESVFDPTVASAAGALGLMQLMPATARLVAAGAGRAPPGRMDLLDPGLNMALGADYLAQMRDRFGHAALATAAYNAGPQRVARWLPVQCTEADLWIAAIPFAETRGYVERVLAYRIIYRARLGLDPVRLSEWLPPVPGRGG